MDPEERIEELERKVNELTSSLIALRGRLHEMGKHPEPESTSPWDSCQEGTCGALWDL